MKKFLILLGALFVGTAVADTRTINWMVDDSTYDSTTCTVGGDLILPTAPTKRGYTFQGWMIYTPIEYIESTGTQYIDTGFAPNQDTRVVMESKIINTPTSHDNFIFSTRTQSNVNAFGVTILSNRRTYRSDYGSNEAFINITGVWDNKLKFDKNKNVLSMYNAAGVKLGETTNAVQTFQSPGAILLPGGISVYPTVFLFDGEIQIYSFQIYDNGILVRDMIPVLDSAGVPCMYDKVSETFFYNAGTGDFIAGPTL